MVVRGDLFSIVVSDCFDLVSERQEYACAGLHYRFRVLVLQFVYLFFFFFSLFFLLFFFFFFFSYNRVFFSVSYASFCGVFFLFDY